MKQSRRVRRYEEMTMNATQTTAVRSSALMQSIFVALIGGLIVFAAGFAQSQTLHDAAHDMRHSTGFPCH
jgi:cobalt transporter subunit CbtB